MAPERHQQLVLDTWKRFQDMQRHPGWQSLRRDAREEQARLRRGLANLDSDKAQECQDRIDALDVPERFLELYKRRVERVEREIAASARTRHSFKDEAEAVAAHDKGRVQSSLASQPGWHDFVQHMEALADSHTLQMNGHDFAALRQHERARAACEKMMNDCRNDIDRGMDAAAYLEGEKE